MGNRDASEQAVTALEGYGQLMPTSAILAGMPSGDERAKTLLLSGRAIGIEAVAEMLDKKADNHAAVFGSDDCGSLRSHWE